MRVIGIDPGTMVTGYGVIDEEDARLFHVASGSITTSSKLPISRRLRKIYEDLMIVLRQYRPGALAVEDTFVAKNPQAALKLGQARGVALLAAEMLDLPVLEYTPAQVKQAVVGHGAATKEQVQGMVVRLLNLKAEPDSHHASDALAVAICHLHSAKMREMLAAAQPPGARGVRETNRFT
jgi:crossover junction endodeoxyribonuclease RuvC